MWKCLVWAHFELRSVLYRSISFGIVFASAFRWFIYTYIESMGVLSMYSTSISFDYFILFHVRLFGIFETGPWHFEINFAGEKRGGSWRWHRMYGGGAPTSTSAKPIVLNITRIKSILSDAHDHVCWWKPLHKHRRFTNGCVLSCLHFVSVSYALNAHSPAHSRNVKQTWACGTSTLTHRSHIYIYRCIHLCVHFIYVSHIFEYRYVYMITTVNLKCVKSKLRKFSICHYILCAHKYHKAHVLVMP